MFDVLQTWTCGLAATLDTALLAVVLERRNRPFARLPIVALLVGAWLVHVGTFLLMAIGPLHGVGQSIVQTVCLVAIAAGVLIKPSAMLHAALRFKQTGFDVNPPTNRTFALLYLPLLTLIPFALTIHVEDSPSLVDPLLRWTTPYVVWVSACNLLAAGVFVWQRHRVDLSGVASFFWCVAGVLVAQTAWLLFVAGYALDAWPEAKSTLLFSCALPSVAVAILFGYFLVRFNFLRLIVERAVLYGALLAGVALFHQFAFQEATAALPRAYRPALIALEGALIVSLMAVSKPLRQRSAEAIRYLMGSRVADRRDRLRRFSIALSAQGNRSPAELLCWFASELTQALDVDFVAGWIFGRQGIVTRFGETSRLDDRHTVAVAAEMRRDGLPIAFPPYRIGTDGMEATQRAAISGAILKQHGDLEGLLLVGRHPRSHDLNEEEANALLFLVEQLAVTLENNRLIADRLAAERRAGQMEKLSALGLMASSIAHEVKNPLSAIKTITAVLTEDLGPESPHAEDLAMIRSEIDRLAATTRQLLDFARPQSTALCSVRINEVLTHVTQILDRLARQKGIAIETRLADDLPTVEASEAALREIFFNLVSNSLDAASAGGRVSVIGLRLNGHVVIEVRDDGAGIPADVRERLFEPFLSTKADGTGLGLHVVGRRVRELGGEIDCESGSGGTSFFVKFPVR